MLMVSDVNDGKSFPTADDDHDDDYDDDDEDECRQHDSQSLFMMLFHCS